MPTTIGHADFALHQTSLFEAVEQPDHLRRIDTQSMAEVSLRHAVSIANAHHRFVGQGFQTERGQCGLGSRQDHLAQTDGAIAKTTA